MNLFSKEGQKKAKKLTEDLKRINQEFKEWEAKRNATRK